MRVVAQRVSEASVVVDGAVVGRIGPGLLLLVGVAEGDAVEDVEAAVDKIAGLRVFPGADGRMDLSLEAVGGEVLVVSQFTLLADIRRGRRPSFAGAAAPEAAEPLIEAMIEMLEARGITTARGVFGAMMSVRLVNEGPVTFTMSVTRGAVS